MTIKAEYMDAAIVAADPTVTTYRVSIDRVVTEGGKPTKATMEFLTFLENAARVRVRRVVAALCGWDVDRLTSPVLDIDGQLGVAVLSREMVDRLKTALLNEKVAAVLDQVIGEADASALLGEIAVL